MVFCKLHILHFFFLIKVYSIVMQNFQKISSVLISRYQIGLSFWRKNGVK